MTEALFMDILRVRFFNAAISGDLGYTDSQGITITLKEFINYFTDINSEYVRIFLPAATIEKGRTEASCTQYLFRVRRGVYRLHPEVIDIHLHQTLQVNELES